MLPKFNQTLAETEQQLEKPCLLCPSEYGTDSYHMLRLKTRVGYPISIQEVYNQLKANHKLIYERKTREKFAFSWSLFHETDFPKAF